MVVVAVEQQTYITFYKLFITIISFVGHNNLINNDKSCRTKESWEKNCTVSIYTLRVLLISKRQIFTGKLFLVFLHRRNTENSQIL